MVTSVGEIDLFIESEPMFPFFVEAYPQDVASPAGQQRLERLRGEVGMTGVALWASTPPFSAMQRSNDRVRIVRSSGGLLYQPQESDFGSSPCRPVVASIAEETDSMRRALDVCDHHGLDVRFVASVLRSGGMARRYGEFVAINALGTKSGDCLCASRAEVRTYAQSLAASLRGLKDDADIVVSDMVSGCDDVLCVPRSCDLALLDTVEQALLTWCFCDSCSEIAGREGIDAEKVRAAVQRVVCDAVDRGPRDECTHESFPAMDEALQAYWTTHLDTVADLFETVQDASGGEVVFAEENMCDVAVSSATTLQVYVGALEEFEGVADENEGPVEIVFPAAIAVGGAGADLTSALKAAVDAEVRGVTVRHLAMIPETAIQPLKQAVRFARRAAGT